MADCTHVQELLSAAADGEHIDRDDLDLARAHCQECRACATFVTTLAAMRRLDITPPPQPTVERLLDVVRAEYQQPSAADSVTSGSVAEPGSPGASGLAGPTALRAPADVRRVPAWAPWAAAAAVVLVVAGAITTQGVRYLLEPSPPGARLSETTVQTPPLGQEQAADQAAPATPPVADGDAFSAANGPSYIVLEGDVYTLTGPADLPAAGARVGEVTTGLDSGKPAVVYAVRRGSTPDSLVLEATDGSALGFSAVTRAFRGTTYALRSGPISAFGQWPSLPDGIPEPASPEGVPTFIEAGVDDLGVAIFVRPGDDPSGGFAIAPSTPPADPAAGNTGWTWWEPRR